MGAVRLALALALAAIGCGGSAAPAAKHNARSVAARPDSYSDAADDRPVTFGPLRVRAHAPELDVESLIPTFHEELRWPLTPMSHPSLTPQFDIASVFAQPGIGWLELCERGVQNRVQAGQHRDELQYLRGWCAASTHDADTAISKLAPLMTSAVAGLSAAVRLDLANIISTAGDANAADKLLNRHHVADVEMFDLLSATYVELGMESSALEMNRHALDSSVNAKPIDHCRRLVKDLVLANQRTPVALQRLRDLATKPKAPDESCVAFYRAARCFIGPSQNCDAYFRHTNIDPRNTYLLQALRAWPDEGTYNEWLSVAEVAAYAGDLAGAQEIVDLAIDTAIRSDHSLCAPNLMHAIHRYTRWSAPGAKPTEREQRMQAELDLCNWVPPTVASNNTIGSTTVPSSTPVSAATAPAPTWAPTTPAPAIDCSDQLLDKSYSCRDQFCRMNIDDPACPQSPKSAPPSDCDADLLKERGIANINMGKHADAFEQFELSLACKDDPYVRQLAFMEACASHDEPKARYHYKRLTPAQQSKFAQICERQKPPVKYSRTPQATAVATSSSTEGCDPEPAKQRGKDYIVGRMHAAALAQFEASLRCKDEPEVRALAFMESCASGNSPKATFYFKRLTPVEQTKLAQLCIRQKPPVAYE